MSLILFWEITMRWDFFSLIFNKEKTKMNAFKFPFFQENGQKFLY